MYIISLSHQTPQLCLSHSFHSRPRPQAYRPHQVQLRNLQQVQLKLILMEMVCLMTKTSALAPLRKTFPRLSSNQTTLSSVLMALTSSRGQPREREGVPTRDHSLSKILVAVLVNRSLTRWRVKTRGFIRLVVALVSWIVGSMIIVMMKTSLIATSVDNHYCKIWGWGISYCYKCCVEKNCSGALG